MNLKQIILDWYQKQFNGATWTGTLLQFRYAVCPGATSDQVRDALFLLHNEGQLYVIYRHQFDGPKLYTIHRTKPGKTLKQAILDWHKDFFVTNWLGQAKSQGTFVEFQDALKRFGAPAQYTEADFQDALRTVGWEIAWIIRNGQYIFEPKPQTTTAQLKTAILAWYKWFFTNNEPLGYATFTNWVKVLKNHGAPSDYSVSQFEVALRQLAEEENIPSKRCSTRVIACSEYYIFPRGTSYEKVLDTGPFSTLDSVIWCYAYRSETRTTYDSLKHWIGTMLDTNASTAFVWGGHAEMIRIAAKSFFPWSVEVDRVPASEIQDALVRLHGEGFCDVTTSSYFPAGCPTIPWWIIQRNGRLPGVIEGLDKKPLRVNDNTLWLSPDGLREQDENGVWKLFKAPESEHTYGRGHGPKDRWDFSLDELFDMLKTLAPDARFEARNINQDGGKPVSQLWAWTPKGCVLLTETTP